MLDLTRTKYFNSTYHLVKFVSDANYTDGSYVLPAFYQVWACFDTANAAFWNESITAAREFFLAVDPWQTETYAPAFGAYMRTNGDDTAAQFSCNALMGFGLPTSTGKPFVDRLWSAPIPTGTYRYYDGTLYMLALLHVSGTFKLYY